MVQGVDEVRASRRSVAQARLNAWVRPSTAGLPAPWLAWCSVLVLVLVAMLLMAGPARSQEATPSHATGTAPGAQMTRASPLGPARPVPDPAPAAGAQRATRAEVATSDWTQDQLKAW